MAEDPRRSTRTIKIRKDHNFVYDEESLRLLTNRLDLNTGSGEHRQPRSEAVTQVEVPVVPSIAGVQRSQEIPVIAASEFIDVFSRLDQVSEEVKLVSHTSGLIPSVVQISAEVSKNHAVRLSGYVAPVRG